MGQETIARYEPEGFEECSQPFDSLGTLPPHGSPNGSGAKGTDAPSAFDGFRFIADRWTGFADRFTSSEREVMVGLVELAHVKGRREGADTEREFQDASRKRIIAIMEGHRNG